MLTKLVRVLMIAYALSPALHAQHAGPQFSAGGQFGYNTGLGIQANVIAADFAQGFPLQLRFGVAYAASQPGQALEARRIFINNATNGTPEKSGRTTGLRLDMLHPVRILSLPRAYVFGGVRHSSFRANFRFIGGNEDFDVTSSHWGLGGGLDSYFAVSRRFDMVVTAGLDYYFSSRLSGHDTSYSPDGDNVNPREDFTYGDADAAVGQPKLGPMLLLGFNYRF
ncbi:MAG: hypothetical protein OEY20_16335 [Gemmatimonadota bacterium]|nr:hypothetical protein [Gemmatimonadota bacterium]MDH5198810.1 hypothetical protein [Gemmatimonadota bacterium]